jgi:Na+-transporting NADH:ubiquinone oxidoreductase subunit A
VPQIKKVVFSMAEIIRIKKGLDIKLKGKAEKIIIKAARAERFAIKPTDFYGVEPKLVVKEQDKVLAGAVLFFDKKRPEVKFTSPVSGVVHAINRGERRRILEVVIAPDEVTEYISFKKSDPSVMSREEIIKTLCDSGLWPIIKQRPYNIIADPAQTPKAIFISGFDTAPLAPDYEFLMNGCEKEFQMGINAIGKLTEGKFHLNIEESNTPGSIFASIHGVQLNKFKGPHPAGNVGTQIHRIDPINKGEVVWVISPQDLLVIGRLFLKGQYDASRIVALTGSEVIKPKYYRTITGSCIRSITEGNIAKDKVRYISGNVLTGTQVDNTGFLGYYDSQITVIPEGDHFEFLGWLAPGVNKFSNSHSFLSWLMPDKEYAVDTNVGGGKRALMITGDFEKVFPFNIYPMQLLKSIIIKDVDQMEKLGIYEVVEEDFALCEFIDTSKTDIQELVRNGLDLMIKEMN